MARALLCPSCGAPLPEAPPGSAVTCGYCKTVTQLPAPPPKPAPRPKPRPRREPRPKRAKRREGPGPVTRLLSFLPVGVALAVGGYALINGPLRELLGPDVDPRQLLPEGTSLPALPPALGGYDGSEPYRCGGNDRRTLRDRDLRFPGRPAVVVEGNCQLRLERVRLAGSVGIELRGNGRLELDDVVVRSTGPALLLEGNARAELVEVLLVSDGAALDLSGNARVTAYSGRVEGAPRAVRSRRRNRVRVHDAELVNRRRRDAPTEPFAPDKQEAPEDPDAKAQPPSIP